MYSAIIPVWALLVNNIAFHIPLRVPKHLRHATLPDSSKKLLHELIALVYLTTWDLSRFFVVCPNIRSCAILNVIRAKKRYVYDFIYIGRQVNGGIYYIAKRKRHTLH